MANVSAAIGHEGLMAPQIHPPFALAVGGSGYNTIGGHSCAYGRTPGSPDFKPQLEGVAPLSASDFAL